MNQKFFFVLLVFSSRLAAQPTIGLLVNSPAVTDGYTLFAPLRSNITYLIDNCGHSVNEWTSAYKPGNAVYLQTDGSLLRAGTTNNTTFTAGGAGGVIEKYDWNGNLTWSFLYSDVNHCQHHDIHPMPNGHVLAIAWERKTLAQAVAAGRDPAHISFRMFSEEIIEVDPGTDSIVWRWKLWDHNIQDFDSTKSNYGVVADHPGLADINFFTVAPDVYHFNGIDYNPVLDQVIISVHNFDEVWIIDHSTTTAEAASHAGGRYGKGGDLLYRWGNPVAYQSGTAADQQLFGQHSPQWIPDNLRYGGSIMVFNNGLGRPGMYSSIEIIQAPQDSAGYYQYNSPQPFGPANPAWTFTSIPASSFYSPLISGVQPLENGHYLICEGDNGVFSEIDSTGDTLWMYVNPVDTAPRVQGQAPFNNSVFRAQKFAPGYAGFAGQLLVPGNLIEQNPLPDTCQLFTGIDQLASTGLEIFPNPVSGNLHIRIAGWEASSGLQAWVQDVTGKLSFEGTLPSGDFRIDCSRWPPGIYFLKIISAGETVVRKFAIQ